jgi:hypothetical protein
MPRPPRDPLRRAPIPPSAPQHHTTPGPRAQPAPPVSHGLLQSQDFRCLLRERRSGLSQILTRCWHLDARARHRKSGVNRECNNRARLQVLCFRNHQVGQRTHSVQQAALHAAGSQPTVRPSPCGQRAGRERVSLEVPNDPDIFPRETILSPRNDPVSHRRNHVTGQVRACLSWQSGQRERTPRPPKHFHGRLPVESPRQYARARRRGQSYDRPPPPSPGRRWGCLTGLVDESPLSYFVGRRIDGFDRLAHWRQRAQNRL